MDASYTAKVAEVNSHVATIRDWRHRMTMRGVSFGGPLRGHAGGHALGALVLCCGAVDEPRYLVPEVKLSPLLPTLFSTELYSLYSLYSIGHDADTACERQPHLHAGPPGERPGRPGARACGHD